MLGDIASALDKRFWGSTVWRFIKAFYWMVMNILALIAICAIPLILMVVLYPMVSSGGRPAPPLFVIGSTMLMFGPFVIPPIMIFGFRRALFNDNGMFGIVHFTVLSEKIYKEKMQNKAAKEAERRNFAGDREAAAKLGISIEEYYRLVYEIADESVYQVNSESAERLPVILNKWDAPFAIVSAIPAAHPPQPLNVKDVVRLQRELRAPNIHARDEYHMQNSPQNLPRVRHVLAGIDRYGVDEQVAQQLPPGVLVKKVYGNQQYETDLAVYNAQPRIDRATDAGEPSEFQVDLLERELPDAELDRRIKENQQWFGKPGTALPKMDGADAADATGAPKPPRGVDIEALIKRHSARSFARALIKAGLDDKVHRILWSQPVPDFASPYRRSETGITIDAVVQASRRKIYLVELRAYPGGAVDYVTVQNKLMVIVDKATGRYVGRAHELSRDAAFAAFAVQQAYENAMYKYCTDADKTLEIVPVVAFIPTDQGKGDLKHAKFPGNIQACYIDDLLKRIGDDVKAAGLKEADTDPAMVAMSCLNDLRKSVLGHGRYFLPNEVQRLFRRQLQAKHEGSGESDNPS